MISWSLVLSRVKDVLDSPVEGIEKTDDEIVDYMKRNVMRKWDYFFPSTNRIVLNTYDDKVKVPGKKSHFFLFDPDGREIKNVKAMYNEMGSLMLFGHDVFGAWSYDQIPQIALQNQQARNTLMYSMYNYNVTFKPPNIIEITPSFEGKCVIEYERSSDIELSDIIPDLEDTFMELCTAMVEMWIGRLRMKFSTYNTQFGDFTVNGENLYNEGQQKYQEIIGKLESSHMCMNATFDYG